MIHSTLHPSRIPKMKSVAASSPLRSAALLHPQFFKISINKALQILYPLSPATLMTRTIPRQPKAQTKKKAPSIKNALPKLKSRFTPEPLKLRKRLNPKPHLT